MPEPKNNPNPAFMVDPPRLVRWLISKRLTRMASGKRIARDRATFEAARKVKGEPHRVHYFHQLDDPYSHLTAQVLARFAMRYDVEVVPHLVQAAGGKNQPELEKLAVWARRDCELVAPHFGLSFPEGAGVVPDEGLIKRAVQTLGVALDEDFVRQIAQTSTAVWEGGSQEAVPGGATEAEARAALDAGSQLLKTMGHYSGATFFYGGEWYWGVDRLFHLEQRLMELGLRRDEGSNYLVPRPEIDVSGVDASALTLHFYPSLNSPYTAIIYDRTLSMAKACDIQLAHKPVLPMIMRGVPATSAKGGYILFDTKREADFFDVPFGPVVTPIGAPTRQAYSLMAWAREQGKDTAFLSSLLRLAFAEGVWLLNKAGLRKAIEAAGLDWSEASKIIGDPAWKSLTKENQDEMVKGMGLWGVPSYRLTGPDGECDLEVWGQDRLWLVAAEIRRRAKG